LRNPQQQQQTLSYADFKEKIAADEVASVTLQGERVPGSLQQAGT